MALPDKIVMIRWQCDFKHKWKSKYNMRAIVLIELCFGFVCVKTALTCSLQKIKINKQELNTRKLKALNERWQNNEIKKKTLDQKNYNALGWSTKSGALKVENNIFNRLSGSFKVFKKIVDSNFRMKRHTVCSTKQILRMAK